MTARIGASILLACLLIHPASAEPFRHSSGEWREYNRDWLAACPDVIDEDATDYYGFSCFASTGSQELNSAKHPAYKLTVMRNRLTGELDIAVTVAADGLQVDTAGDMTLAFSGGGFERLKISSDLETRYGTTNQFYVVEPARKAALLDRMTERNAVVLTVPVEGDVAASKSVRLSLRGVTASIDFMATYARRISQY